MHRSTTLFLVLILGLFGIACSSGHGTTNPVTPGLTSAGPTVSAQASLIERDLWGWWNVAIDTATGEVEFAPFREAMFRANVTQWLQPPIGSYTNLKIIVDDMSTYFDDGRITVDVALTHPFPGFVEYTGFDVQGVFIHDGPVSDTYDPDINYAIRAEDAAVLENADGYTRWFNFPEFNGGIPILGWTPGGLGNISAPTANLNPYKYFCNELGPEDDLVDFTTGNIELRGVFANGVTNTRKYHLQFPMPGGQPLLTYQYAVTASWEPGDPALGGVPDVWDVPEDFPLSANQAEPFAIGIDSSASTLYYVDGTDFGGDLVLDLEIFRWSALDPASDGLGISRIAISACDSCDDYPVNTVFEGAALDAAIIPGSGSAVSSVYHVEITGVDPGSAGLAPFLVTVEPETPSSYDQGFGTPVPDALLAAYKLGWVNISVDPGCIPPTCIAVATTSTDIPVGNSVVFDASGTTGTPPFTWEWDWENDGEYDESTDQPIIEHFFNMMGTYLVMCKATNACGEDELDEPIEVNATCGTGTPTYSNRYEGSGDTCPYYFSDLNATYYDSDPKLIAPGGWFYASSERKILLASISNPTTAAAEYTWSGMGDIYGKPGRMALDSSTDGIDRIVFNPNVSPSAPVIVDWDGTSFSNETILPSTPYGSIWTLCVTDEGDIIAHNNIGPNTSVYLWDKSNNYAVGLLFTFQNNSSSLPYGSSLGNIGQLAYDPATETILFPVGNSSISTGGQLYGFTLDGTRVFADSNVFEANVGSSRLFGVTVDMHAPSCRVIFHGAPNYGSMWLARFVNDLEDKYIVEITNGSANSGGKHGAFAGGYFWTNTNNWNWHVLRYDLPTDW